MCAAAGETSDMSLPLRENAFRKSEHPCFQENQLISELGKKAISP